MVDFRCYFRSAELDGKHVMTQDMRKTRIESLLTGHRLFIVNNKQLYLVEELIASILGTVHLRGCRFLAVFPKLTNFGMLVDNVICQVWSFPIFEHKGFGDIIDSLPYCPSALGISMKIEYP